jgi:hypothetical protein
MQLGKELATGFVSDEAQATADGEAGLPPDGTDAKAPEVPPLPAPVSEPAAAGWAVLGTRAAQERPDLPYTGFKLAHAVLAADGGRAGFAGLSIGAQRVYGSTAEASCVWTRRHAPPRRRCGCGFYCLNSLAEARALSCASANRAAVLLEVVASGRFIRYERGLRYSRQRVRAVRVGSCGCGRSAAGLTDAGQGLVGWRCLMPSCAACAAHRYLITFGSLAARLGGLVPVTADEGAASWPGQITDGGVRPGVPFPAGLPDAEAIAALDAEIALVHARLDHLQAQLSRLQGGPAADP